MRKKRSVLCVQPNGNPQFKTNIISICPKQVIFSKNCSHGLTCFTFFKIRNGFLDFFFTPKFSRYFLLLLFLMLIPLKIESKMEGKSYTSDICDSRFVPLHVAFSQYPRNEEEFHLIVSTLSKYASTLDVV